MDPVARANYMQAIHLLHCETDKEGEALLKLKEGAKAGFRPSIRALGSRIVDDPSLLGDEAGVFFKIFLREADAGSASAANVVGAMATEGVGTKRDLAAAAKYFRTAAADGSQRAIEWLTYAAATGVGGRVDRATAQRHHARLDKDRAIRAAKDIVVALELGREGKRDEAAARFWADLLRRLDKDSDTKVALDLEKAWRNGTDVKDGLDILSIAKRYGGMEARYQLALRQFANDGEAQRSAALADLRSAAVAGHLGAAQTMSALMVASGADGTIATQASDTLRQAVSNGNPSAMVSFANQIYFADTSMPKLWLAAQYLRRAAESGLPEAQHRLGLLLLDGLGIEKDRALATSWLAKAQDAGYPLSKEVLDSLGSDERK
jgi:TPR repeat protein